MPSRIHAIVPRVAVALAPVLLLAAAAAYLLYGRPYEVPADTDIFTVVQGTWAWTPSDNNCATNPHTIAFTADRGGMIITAAHPIAGRMGGSIRSRSMTSKRTVVVGFAAPFGGRHD